MTKTISLLMVFIVVMTLVSCGVKPEQPNPEEHINLEVVFNEAGKTLATYGAGNSEGFYDIVPRIWSLEDQLQSGELDHNIIYIDYSSKTRVFLCSDPSCRHDTENCTSFIRASSSMAVFPVGERLVCIEFGRTDEAKTIDDLGAVMVMNLDGSDRKTIYHLDRLDSFSQPLIFLSDGERLFFQIISVNEDNNAEKRVLSLNLDTGESAVEIEVPLTYMLVSSYDDCMVFYDIETATNMVYTLSAKIMRAGLSGVSGVYKNSFSVDLEYDVAITAFQDVFTAKSIMIKISDIQHGVTDELGLYELEEGHSAVGLTDFYDGHICISYITRLEEATETVSYNLNLLTGELVKNQLFFYSGNINKPTAIIADAGDSYLVYSDTIRATQTFSDRQGVAHTVENNSHQQYALIKKEDYYSNEPNYYMIRDNTCDIEIRLS